MPHCHNDEEIAKNISTKWNEASKLGFIDETLATLSNEYEGKELEYWDRYYRFFYVNQLIVILIILLIVALSVYFIIKNNKKIKKLLSK